MGFIRKITGAQGQINAMNKQADAQISAAKQAADQQVASLNAAAQAAADAQRIAADRAKVESNAAELASQPMAVADVALSEPQSGSAGTARRKVRAQFGKSYGTGVSI